MIHPPTLQEILEFENSFLSIKLANYTKASSDEHQELVLTEHEFYTIIKHSIRYLELSASEKINQLITLLEHVTPPPKIMGLFACYIKYMKACVKYLYNEFNKSLTLIENLALDDCYPYPQFPHFTVEVHFLKLNNLIRLQKSDESLRLATKIIEEIDEKLTWRRIYAFSRLGNAYYANGNFTIAKRIYSQTLQMLDFEDHHLSFILHNNMGVTCYQLGDLEESAKHLKLALNYTQQETMKNNNAIGLIYQNLGEIHIFENNFDLAEEYLNKSVQYLKRNNPPFYYFLSDSLILLLQISGIKHDYSRMKVLLDEIKKITDINNTPSLINNLNIAYLLYDLSTGNLYSAYKRFHNITSLKENQEPVNILAWRMKSFISLMLYSFTRNKVYLEDAKKNMNIVVETKIIKENLVFNVQQLYLKILIATYENKPVNSEDLAQFEAYINQLPNGLRQRYESLRQFLELGSSFTLPLTLTDIFQISYPSTIYSRVKVIRPFNQVIEEIALYKVSDLGPEIVFASGNISDSYIVERLGTFSIILIGTGDRYPEGFWGPLPTSQPEYNALIISKIVNDRTSMDNRRKGWVFSVLNFYYKSNIVLSEKELEVIREKGLRLYKRIDDISLFTHEEWMEWIKTEFKFLESYNYES